MRHTDECLEHIPGPCVCGLPDAPDPVAMALGYDDGLLDLILMHMAAGHDGLPGFCGECVRAWAYGPKGDPLS